MIEIDRNLALRILPSAHERMFDMHFPRTHAFELEILRTSRFKAIPVRSKL